MLAAIRFLLFFMCSIPLWANTQSYSWYTMDAKKQVTLNVELFLSSTCPHCQKADAFFKEIEPKTPWLHIQRHLINQDKDALTLFNQFLTEQKASDFAVPSMFFCNSRWLGFESAETTGKDLLNALNYCKQQIEKKGTLTDAAVNVIKRWANANMYNASMTEQPSILQYLLVVVFLDITNSCSLFCFFGFLAVLSIQHSKKNQLLTGCLFILAIVFVHWFQQTQTNIFYQILPWFRIVAVIMGLSSLYLAVLYYRKQVIKPYLLFIWTFFFALTVYAYQQTCVMNWSYIFEQWLTNQRLSGVQPGLLQLIYQVLYCLPLIVVLLVYWLLSSFNFFKSALENIGLLFISFIALFLLIQPALLSYYLISYLTLLLGIVAGIIVNWYRNKKQY